MYLVFHELAHVGFSIIGALIAYRIVWRTTFHTKQLVLSIICALIGGILIDLDHLFDYFLALGFQFDLNTFLQGLYFRVHNDIILPFHGWEYVTLLLIWGVATRHKTRKLIVIALAFGIWFHLAVDVILNYLPPQSYSILYRISVDFDIDKLNYQPEDSHDILQ